MKLTWTKWGENSNDPEFVEQEVDELIRPILASSSRQEQLDALQVLAEKDLPKESDFVDRIAVSLIQEVVVAGSATEDALFIACSKACGTPPLLLLLSRR